MKNSIGTGGLGPVALVIGAMLTPTVLAGPMSDIFQPDAFGTGTALKERIPGLSDPFDQDCPIPKGDLTLAAAVNLALCRSPATKSAWATAHQQAAALGSTESAWLPSITASGGESREVGSHVDVTGNIVSERQDTSDALVQLSWTLYDFGGREGHIRSARHLLDATAANVNAVSQQTAYNVVQSYYGAVAADATLVATETTEGVASHSLEAARALRTGGVATLADVLQAETAYDQAVLARIQAERAMRGAHGTLAVAVGVNADQPLKLAADPVPAKVPALTARMADLMAEAQRQRPDLGAALAQRDSAEADVTVARAVGRPSIALSAGYDWSNTSFIPRQNYSEIGLTLTVPIFTGFNVGYQVRQAQSVLQAKEVNVEQVRLTVSLDVWNAYYALDSANQLIEQTATLIQTAQNNEDVALGRYQSGVGTIIDLLTAQTAAANARELRINAELGWQVARAQLALAVGRLAGAEPLNMDPPAR